VKDISVFFIPIIIFCPTPVRHAEKEKEEALRFKEKVALVTGAGRNIGAAIARAFAAEGAAVALIDIDASAAEKTAGQIKTEGGNCRAWSLDVGMAEAVAEISNQVRAHFGAVHILVNNAAVVPRTSESNAMALDLPEDIWDQAFRVNVKGAFLMSREVGRLMIQDGAKGRIVNIISAAAESPRVGAVQYCCSKAALAMLTRVLALELAPHGITVNSVSPGLIQVPQTAPLTPGRREYRDAFLRGIPMNRFGHPEEVARAVLFLAEDGSEYITGDTIRVDGGTLAGRSYLPKSV
jgi:NAD(P)-dependent dehydrogenase (short-subunit alcohol dehydrogenase family)